MIDLDARYHSYLSPEGKKLNIDGEPTQVIAYGYLDNGKHITGYYLQTPEHRLIYKLNEQFDRLERKGIDYDIEQTEYEDPYTWRGVAQLGSAVALGAIGRRFESCHPDLVTYQHYF